MPITYTLTKNPGNLFRLSGSWILVNTTSLALGKSYPVTVKIDNGLGTVTLKNLVLAAGAVSSSLKPTLQFNRQPNSQYIGTAIGGV